MSQTAITLAFEQWKAQQAATGEPVLLDEFVFALVPGLDPGLPVDRSETLPPAAQIVCREPVTRKGVVNENAVVHSVVLGADVGDFSFNWIGLTNKASGTLAMVVHAPEQQKLKTKEGQQGNVLTRSFLMEYNGAQTETAINTPAETWQIDFTARMAGMDERQRLENMDIYGTAAFFDDGWLVGKNANQYFVTKGAGYVAGLRAVLAANQNITVTTKPVNVWLDVCWTGALTSAWTVQSKLTVTANLTDYEQNGVKHYVFALASIDASGNITDLRPKGSLDDQQASDALKKHEQSRNHPDATTSAKGFTQLSSATDSTSETLAATPKAVKGAVDAAKSANDNANTKLALSGGVMTGAITTSGDGHGSYASQNGAKAPVYQQIDSTSTSEYWPLIKQKYVQGNSTWSVGRIINQDDMVVHYISAADTAGKTFYFKKDGTFVPPNYANFDAKYQAKGNYTPAGQAYTKAESDGRFQPKGSYTPAGQAYTKAESDGRYPLKTATVIGVRVSARGSIGTTGGTTDVDAPVGSFITGRSGSNGDVRYSLWYTRSLQINVNGAWKTITA
ncbi:phage tail protein [Enterobacter ludwigii]